MALLFIKERGRHEAATWANALVEASDEQRHHKAAAQAAESEALALIKERR